MMTFLPDGSLEDWMSCLQSVQSLLTVSSSSTTVSSFLSSSSSSEEEYDPCHPHSFFTLIQTSKEWNQIRTADTWNPTLWKSQRPPSLSIHDWIQLFQWALPGAPHVFFALFRESMSDAKQQWSHDLILHWITTCIHDSLDGWIWIMTWIHPDNPWCVRWIHSMTDTKIKWPSHYCIGYMRACAIRYASTVEYQQKEWTAMSMRGWCSNRCWSRLVRFYHDRMYWNSQMWKGDVYLFLEWMQTHSESWIDWFQFACWIGDVTILKTIHACQKFVRQWAFHSKTHLIVQCTSWKELILVYANQIDSLQSCTNEVRCAYEDLLELRYATLSNQWDSFLQQYKKS